ncbi:histidine kinase [Arthrobacter sp. NEB 688]|uniref:sensor histidine kinase n=1 Tax=Arthrobacter sp. NEB 688 TaxID=904039 RepID=UPI001566520B|nr:histidine kinase [Arthrobacter sp. NEB 688]QKE83169.1 two-component sensor histidine kinase [Arthrobacter sp. NEB 688]
MQPPRRRLPTALVRGGLVLAAGWTAALNTAAVAGGSFATAGSAAAVATSAALLVPRVPWWAPPAVAAAAAGWFGWPFLFLLVIAVVDLAGRRRVAWAVGLGVAALALSAVVGGPATLWVPQQFGSPLVLVLGIVVGLWSGSRRRLITALEQQVTQRDVERGLREEQARASERARIAAEMHDVLAHRLSLIALHTGVLEATSNSLPPKVAERAALLRTASTEALDDLRSVLTVLREPDPTEVEPPTTGDLDELVAAARAAGQEVRLVVTGEAALVPAAHRLAVHRVVREGLTNVRKHAGGATSAVEVTYGPPLTTATVRSPLRSGSASPAADPGFGIVGLRERVHAVGGTLDVGARHGEWVLGLHLPTPEHRSAPGTGAVVR